MSLWWLFIPFQCLETGHPCIWVDSCFQFCCPTGLWLWHWGAPEIYVINFPVLGRDGSWVFIFLSWSLWFDLRKEIWDRMCYGHELYPLPDSCVQAPSLRTSECDCTWRISRSHEIKMRSLGWALIPCDWYKKRHIKGRLGEYTGRKWPSTCQEERPWKKPNLLIP